MMRRTLVVAAVLLLASIALATVAVKPPTIEPSKPLHYSGVLKAYGDKYFTIGGLKPGYMIHVNATIWTDEHSSFTEVAIIIADATVTSEAFVAEPAKKNIALKYYIAKQWWAANYTEFKVRVATSRHPIHYDLTVYVTTRYDDGLGEDAGDFDQAKLIGELKMNSSIGFKGWIHGKYDQVDCYKIKLTGLHGDAVLDVTAVPSDAPLLELVVYSEDGFRIGYDRAREFNGSVHARVKYSDVEGDRIIRVEVLAWAERASYYNLTAALTGSQAPAPSPQPPPIWPPSEIVPHLWLLILLLILFLFWVIGAKPVGKLKKLNEVIERNWLKLVKAARKIVRCAEPAPIKPTATYALGKLLLGVFLLSSGSLTAWIMLFGYLPATVLTVNGFPKIFTYLLLHANIQHLAVNIAFLLTVAPWLEYKWGKGELIALFFTVFNFGAVLFHTIYAYYAGLQWVYCIGASGAISGYMGAFYVYFRDKHFIVAGKKISSTAWLATWFIIQLLLALTNTGGGVAYMAHVGGFLTGAIYARVRG